MSFKIIIVEFEYQRFTRRSLFEFIQKFNDICSFFEIQRIFIKRICKYSAKKGHISNRNKF